MMSSKSDNFKRLASARTQKLLAYMDVLANLSNRNNYDYTDEEVEIIFSALESKIASIKQQFMTTPSKKFTL